MLGKILIECSATVPMKFMIYASESRERKLEAIEKVLVLVADFVLGIEFFIEGGIVDVELMW